MLAYIFILKSVLQQNSLEQKVTKPEAALFLTESLWLFQANVITNHATNVASQLLCSDARLISTGQKLYSCPTGFVVLQWGKRGLWLNIDICTEVVTNAININGTSACLTSLQRFKNSPYNMAISLHLL